MRIALDPRAQRLLRRLPRTTVYSALELVFLSLLAVQCARLVWTILTPVGPVGEWKAQSELRPVAPGSAALLAGFDPFFRLNAQAGPIMVTALALKLYGVRENRASGGGSAIISIPDGTQRSFAVGDEIVPGVILTAVAFDNVTVTRNGAPEQLYMDQSGAAPVANSIPGAPPSPSFAPPTLAPPPSAPPSPTPVPVVTVPPRNLSSEIRFQPRMDGGQLTGVAVQPQGGGEAFRAAGLAPGDVIVSVNGRKLTSPDQARTLAGQLGGGDVRVQVERDGRVVPLTVKAGR